MTLAGWVMIGLAVLVAVGLVVVPMIYARLQARIRDLEATCVHLHRQREEAFRDCAATRTSLRQARLEAQEWRAYALSLRVERPKPSTEGH